MIDLHTSLRLDVDELTRTHLQTHETAYSIDGQALVEKTSGQVPGLIAQLRESTTEGIGGNGGASGFHPKIPIAVGAYTLYESIQKTAGNEYERLTGTRKHSTIEDNIQGWAAHATINPTEQEHCLNTLDRWIDDIQEMLNPPRRWELSHPCPICKEKYVIRVVDDEKTRAAALIVTARDGGVASCRACGVEWTSGEWQELAEAL